MKSLSKKRSLAPSPKEEGLYDEDFAKWASCQTAFLKKGKFARLDIAHLIEEIEGLSKQEKQRLTSHLEVLLMHKLKVKFQPHMHTSSWDYSIIIASHRAQETLSENRSLKPKLKERIEEAYFYANPFPETCPWNVKDLFPSLEEKDL